MVPLHLLPTQLSVLIMNPRTPAGQVGGIYPEDAQAFMFYPEQASSNARIWFPGDILKEK